MRKADLGWWIHLSDDFFYYYIYYQKLFCMISDSEAVTTARFEFGGPIHDQTITSWHRRPASEIPVTIATSRRCIGWCLERWVNTPALPWLKSTGDDNMKPEKYLSFLHMITPDLGGQKTSHNHCSSVLTGFSNWLRWLFYTTKHRFTAYIWWCAEYELLWMKRSR